MRTLARGAGVGLFALLGVFYVAFGAFYASVSELLWFHAAAVPKEALVAVRPIYFALMKLIGGATIALGVLGVYSALGPVRLGVAFSGRALAVAYAVPLVAAAYVAETLAATTGAPTSWNIMGALLGVDALALLAHAAGRRRD
jgi:hypothetical protein